MDEKRRTKDEYLDEADVGALVAFRDDTGKMISAKIAVRPADESGRYTLETKNGSIYYVYRTQIEWVRQPGRGWPSGIYNAFTKSRKEVEN